MLDMMLSNSPEGFSAGEVYALFRPYRPINFELKPKCGCGNPDCDFWFKIRKAGEKHLYKAIFRQMPEVSFIVDSSKEPWWIKQQSEYLKSQGIDVFHILIWKEPAAFAYSMHKRVRKHWKKFWKNYHRLYFSFIKNYIVISYSDLVKSPEILLSDLCRKTGLVFHSGKEKYWNKKHHTLFGNKSAKIHLYGKNEESIEQDNFERQESHQTIYHNTGYLDLLPDEIKHDIKNDPDLKKIVSVLKDESSPSLDICFSSSQLELRKISWAIKLVIGRVLGRYWQLF